MNKYIFEDLAQTSDPIQDYENLMHILVKGNIDWNEPNAQDVMQFAAHIMSTTGRMIEACGISKDYIYAFNKAISSIQEIIGGLEIVIPVTSDKVKTID